VDLRWPKVTASVFPFHRIAPGAKALLAKTTAFGDAPLSVGVT
jgi:hypothetical protein